MTDQRAHGGLRLGVVAGVGETESKEISERWQKYDEVDRYLTMNLGITATPEPGYGCPELTPSDMAQTDSALYTELYTKRTAWFGFLCEKKAEHDAMLLEIKEEMADIEVRTRDKLRKANKRTTRAGEPKAPPAAEMSDHIHMDPRYIELKQKKLFHEEVLVRLNARVEKLDRELRLTSRNVEIRRQDFDTTNRGANIAGRGGLPSRGMRYPSGGGG